jgi:hypothetical protein
MGAETGYFRGENGLILRMDLPLPEVYHQRLVRQEIVRVKEDGSPWEGPDDVVVTPELMDRSALLARDLDDARAELDLATRQRDNLVTELAEVKVALEAARARIAEMAVPPPPPDVPPPPPDVETPKKRRRSAHEPEPEE